CRSWSSWSGCKGPARRRGWPSTSPVRTPSSARTTGPTPAAVRRVSGASSRSCSPPAAVSWSTTRTRRATSGPRWSTSRGRRGCRCVPCGWTSRSRPACSATPRGRAERGCRWSASSRRSTASPPPEPTRASARWRWCG
ncbi:MAG: hypothetical protein AVDCRST_MAG07-1550, partial [uncultured Frankineae bacterium]